MAYTDQTTLRYNTFPQAQNDFAILAASASNFANTAWVEMIPGYGQPIHLWALEVIIPNLAVTECEIEIGLGPAGAEVVSGVVKTAVINANSSVEPLCPFFVPLEVPEFTRVAFRIRHEGGDSLNFVLVGLNFLEQPQVSFPTRGHRGRRYPR